MVNHDYFNHDHSANFRFIFQPERHDPPIRARHRRSRSSDCILVHKPTGTLETGRFHCVPCTCSLDRCPLVIFMFLIVCVHCSGFLVIVFFIHLTNILNGKFAFEHIYTFIYKNKPTSSGRMLIRNVRKETERCVKCTVSLFDWDYCVINFKHASLS